MFDVLPLPIELRGAVFAVWPFFDAASTTNLSPGSFPNRCIFAHDARLELGTC